jgi:23S rRNA (adenine-N6)-dimethyltransferase
MAKKPSQRITLAQNFLKSPKLVRLLISASTISSYDTVYDVGAGRGVITAELARIARKVIAIEEDATLIKELHHRFQGVDNVKLMEGDFLRYRIPDREYKIFANIPYNITADIVRRILYVPPVPSEA